MTDSNQLIALFGVLFAYLAGQIGVITIINEKRIKNSNLVALIISLILSFVAGYLYFRLNYGFWAIFSISIFAFFFVVIIITNIPKLRDWFNKRFPYLSNARGIEFGNRLLKIFNEMDEQIHFIHEKIAEPNASKRKILAAIYDCLSWILSVIARIFDLKPGKDDSHLSLLYAKKGKFEVLSSQGIPSTRISLIEEKFSYGKKVQGVAGKAASLRCTIYIPDLSDVNNKYVSDWIPLEPTEERKGSLISIPIIKTVKKVDTIMGVINITSKRTNVFNTTAFTVLTYIADRIQILLYLYEAI